MLVDLEKEVEKLLKYGEKEFHKGNLEVASNIQDVAIFLRNNAESVSYDDKMDEKTAMAILLAEIRHHPEMSIFCEALHIAIQALKERIAKKPIIQSTDEKTHYKCKCGYIFLTRYKDGFQMGSKPTYCERCGRRIDWS